MIIHLDDYETCYVGSHSVIEMDVVPRVGEDVKIKASMLNSRFFNDPGYKDVTEGICDGYVYIIITEVSYVVNEGGQLARLGFKFEPA